MDMPSREDRYFEDYRPGASYEFGTAGAGEQEIVEFARKFDPQSFHVDPAAAVDGPFGGLIASGWHTLSLMMRLLVDHYLPGSASLGSPGVDEVRWLRPVRPGDVLRVRATVLEATPSRSKPDRGLVRTGIELLNQHDETVTSLKALNFIRSRP